MDGIMLDAKVSYMKVKLENGMMSKEDFEKKKDALLMAYSLINLNKYKASRKKQVLAEAAKYFEDLANFAN